MGYAFITTIPESGKGNVPISVSGETLITAVGDYQVAYDPSGFNTGQYTSVLGGTSSAQVLRFSNSGKTLLWIRQDPAGGLPVMVLNVWTDIGSVNL